MFNVRFTALSAVTLALILSQTACMRTRSQIRTTGEAQSESTSDEPRYVSSAQAKTNAPAQRYDIEEIKNELTRLTGRVEELDHSQRNQNTGELKEYITRIDGRVAEVEKNQVLILSELKALKDKEVQSAKEAAANPDDLLADANKMLASDRFSEAADKFQQAISKGLKGKEAAEAHFGAAEAEYGQKNYKKAIVHYSKIQEVYPKSARIPASLYRMGLAFQHLNMKKEARGFFAELVERYPRTSEAKRARAKIKE